MAVPAIAPLVSALRDSDSKTRANAAGAIGNLLRHSAALDGELAMLKAPDAVLAMVIAGDSLQAAVSVGLLALGTMAKRPRCHAALEHLGIMVKLATVEKPLPKQPLARLKQKLGVK